jgi:sugar phosphate permease
LSNTPPLKHSRVIANSPFYYGWVILLAGTFGMIMTTPGQTTGVSVFLDKIIEDLGLSRSAVSLMYTLGTLMGSFALPFVGRFIDRRGPRITVTIITALFAVACVWMGFVTGLITLLIGFTLIRGLGQGALGLVSIHVINIWFVKRRGMAVGLAGVGVAVATAFFPLLIESLINRFEWRQTYMLLGGLVAVTILPVGAWLYREHPERFGLLPDSQTGPETTSVIEELNYNFQQARRTLTFWLFAGSGFLVSALSTGLVFHHYSIMAESGLDRITAGTMFISLGFIMAGANLFTGLLVDQVAPRYPLSVMLIFLVAALLFAPHVATVPMILAYGGVLGTMQGMSGTLQASVYAYYFGRKHIGSIKGFASTLTVFGSAFGPLLFAVGFETFGSYVLILAVSAVLPLLIAVVAPFLKLKQNGRIL